MGEVSGLGTHAWAAQSRSRCSGAALRTRVRERFDARPRRSPRSRTLTSARCTTSGTRMEPTTSSWSCWKGRRSQRAGQGGALNEQVCGSGSRSPTPWTRRTGRGSCTGPEARHVMLTKSGSSCSTSAWRSGRQGDPGVLGALGHADPRHADDGRGLDLGTFQYMRPEQQIEGEEADGRSDIFASERSSTRWPRARGPSRARARPR